jgi:hypothetical protein
MDTDLLRMNSSDIKCSVCLDITIEENTLCSTNCSHQFCKSCLDKWFNTGKTTCPMCRSEITYFNYQGDDNRVVKVINYNQMDIQLINRLYIKIKSYKVIIYTLLLVNLYASYTILDDHNDIDFYKDNYRDCMKNLTDSNIYTNHLLHDNNELINNNNELINNELINNNEIINNNELRDNNELITNNELRDNNKHFSLINMFLNNKFYQCLFPEYYVDKCINEH